MVRMSKPFTVEDLYLHHKVTELDAAPGERTPGRVVTLEANAAHAAVVAWSASV